MKRWGPLVILLGAAAATAQARLGESTADIARRYGPPTTPVHAVEYVYRDHGDTQARYEKDTIKILVVFQDGKSQYESIARKNPTLRLAPSEIKAFIEANASGSVWPEPKASTNGTSWIREDGNARAVLTADGKTLTVMVTLGGAKGF